jgi:hypothetical protein
MASLIGACCGLAGCAWPYNAATPSTAPAHQARTRLRARPPTTDTEATPASPNELIIFAVFHSNTPEANQPSPQGLKKLHYELQIGNLEKLIARSACL